MSRSVKILFGVAGALVILSGPASLVGMFMVHHEMGNYSPEFSITDYFNSLLATWVAPPLIMIVLGIHLVIVALIIWFYQRKRRPAVSGKRQI